MEIWLLGFEKSFNEPKCWSSESVVLMLVLGERSGHRSSVFLNSEREKPGSFIKTGNYIHIEQMFDLNVIRFSIQRPFCNRCVEVRVVDRSVACSAVMQETIAHIPSLSQSSRSGLLALKAKANWGRSSSWFFIILYHLSFLGGTCSRNQSSVIKCYRMHL